MGLTKAVVLWHASPERFWKLVLTEITVLWVVKNDKFLETHNTECYNQDIFRCVNRMAI